MDMRITDAEAREALRILRVLSRIRGHTLLTAKELDALRRGRLLLKKITNVMTRIEQIRREARDIQNLLECTTFSDIDSMVGRLDQLGVYYARSGALLSEVVGMRDAAVAKLFHDEKETILSLSPSLANKLIGSASSELNALEKWLDRINAACKHQCDNLRTMISFEKERMRL